MKTSACAKASCTGKKKNNNFRLKKKETNFLRHFFMLFSLYRLNRLPLVDTKEKHHLEPHRILNDKLQTVISLEFLALIIIKVR